MSKLIYGGATDEWFDNDTEDNKKVEVAHLDTTKLEGLIQAFNALPSPVHIGQSKADGQDIIHISIGTAKYGTNIVSDSYNKDIVGIPCKINITYTMKAGERLRLDNIRCLFERIVQTTSAFVEQEFARLEYTEPLKPLVKAIAKIRKGIPNSPHTNKLINCIDNLCKELGVEVDDRTDIPSFENKEV